MKPSVRAEPLSIFPVLLAWSTLLSILVAVDVAQASDPPHWTGANTTIDCTTPCHTTHNAPGGTLTSEATNINLCHACHLSGDLSVSNDDKASPHVTGTSHAFEVPAVNATYGTQDPENSEMLLRVMDGDIVCSTCHNQHIADGTMGGTARVTDPDPVSVSGGGSVAIDRETTVDPETTNYNGSSGYFYWIQIVKAGDVGAAKYCYAELDGRNNVAWFPDAVQCPSPGEHGTLTGANESIGTHGIVVDFTGSGFVVGDKWEFYASWPFLRTTLDKNDIETGDRFCRDCHRSWVMDHDSDLVGGGGIRTYDGNPKSHPVGVGLDANTKGYDRAQPLDGNGAVQGSAGADSNPSNDLLLDAFGNVQCLSCHGVHHADSNTLSVDSP